MGIPYVGHGFSRTHESAPMIIDLEGYRIREAARRAFSSLIKPSGDTYPADLRFRDLSDKTLYFLSQSSRESDMAYYELIMGALNLGKPAKFYYLNNRDQLKVVDIHLFLMDQVRFEVMHRLGWLDGFAAAKYPLLELVMAFDRIKPLCIGKPLCLSPRHPGYAAFSSMVLGDREAFIRRLLPEAMESFQHRLEK